MNELLHLDLQIENISSNDQLEKDTRQLYSEIKEMPVKDIRYSEKMDSPAGAKGDTSILLGALVISLAPTMLTKFLDFLHVWVLRREGRIIKIKLQTQKDQSIEFEIPASVSKSELENFIKLANASLKPRRKRSQHER